MSNKDKSIDFESKLAELQRIVEMLESDVSLADSMKLFENGLNITKECIDELNKTREDLASLEERLNTVLSSVSGSSDER